MSNRETVAKILDSIPQPDFKMEEGDYIGEDGLIYCGSCHTPKQTVKKVPPGLYGDTDTKVFACLCKCGSKKLEEEKKAEEYRQEMYRIQRRRDASMMDGKYQGARFSGYTITPGNERAYRTATKYAEEFERMFQENQGLLLYGPVGTGKSFTAACIANELLDKNVSVVMTSFVKILQNIQGEDESGYISMLNNAKLLILDDLGTDRNTDYALEKVYNIVDSRSRVSKPMILTTNLDLQDMMQAEDIRYKRIYDRILETCYPVRVSGDSFRRISAEQRFDRMAKFMEG